MLLAAGLTLWGTRHLLLNAVGEFLVVAEEENTGPVDAAVSGGITDRVVQCYLSRNCRKVVLLRFAPEADAWRTRSAGDDEVRKQARTAGILPEDLILTQARRVWPREYVRFLQTDLRQHGIRSAVVFMPYFKTRRFRFLFDRYWTAPEIRIYVQPTTVGYRQSMEHWWENTMLDNLFLEEYLKMAHYYFNKVLLTRGV